MPAVGIQEWTLVVAVITLIAAIVVPFYIRHRDRVDLEITQIEDSGGDEVVLVLRNHGGTPTRVRVIAFEHGGTWPGGGIEPVAGRGEIRSTATIGGLARSLDGAEGRTGLCNG